MQGNAIKATQGNGCAIVTWLWNVDQIRTEAAEMWFLIWLQVTHL